MIFALGVIGVGVFASDILLFLSHVAFAGSYFWDQMFVDEVVV
jgi:hypothetical protein